MPSFPLHLSLLNPLQSSLHPLPSSEVPLLKVFNDLLVEFHKAFLGVDPLDLLGNATYPALLGSVFSPDLCSPGIPTFPSPLWSFLFPVWRISVIPAVHKHLWTSCRITLISHGIEIGLPPPRLENPETTFFPLFLWFSISSGSRRSYFSSEVALSTHCLLDWAPSTRSMVAQTLLILCINKIRLYNSFFQFLMVSVLCAGLGGLKSRILSSHGSGGQKSKRKAPSGLVSDETLLSCRRPLPSVLTWPLCVCRERQRKTDRRRRERERAPWYLFFILSKSVWTLMTLFNLYYLLKAPSPSHIGA